MVELSPCEVLFLLTQVRNANALVTIINFRVSLAAGADTKIWNE